MAPLNPAQIYGPTSHPQLDYLPNNRVLYHKDRTTPRFSLPNGIPTVYDEFGVGLPYITPPLRMKAMHMGDQAGGPHRCVEHHVHRFRLSGRYCYCNSDGDEGGGHERDGHRDGHNEYICIYECPGTPAVPGKVGTGQKCTQSTQSDSPQGCPRISCAFERRGWVKGPRCIPENTTPTTNQSMIVGDRIKECLNCTRKAWLWCAEGDCMTRLCPNCVMEECTRDSGAVTVVRERHAGISEEEMRMMEEEEKLRREWERLQELGEGAEQDYHQRAKIWERQQGEVERQQREFNRHQQEERFEWSPGMEGRLGSGGYL
ncbi:hypothetical protein FPQ18DRAFT_324131 [Pyronema domesticum]|uniref:Uncharacterized protein n=1 Tax=Pyronema omphalodes (strain CBS 100304) TaxID=1076935 RepID=U4LBT2_PYROM|nr:hypothetical protein FPQ18DRAFT_324131 [Pyronema domesticum]CCX29569.1 Protein of unknown function [Pyronema omphalodes CBS 100304]